MSTQLEIVGTRVAGATTYASLFDRELAPDHALCISSAYWDATALRFVRDLAVRAGTRARVVLWVPGGSKRAWRGLEFARDDEHLDLRFVDSPEEDGILHVKLAGAARSDGTWSCALLGSCNLTSRALTRNVELGVAVRGDSTTLAQLRAWFDQQFDHALPAAEINWDEAVRRAPESIAKVHGQGGEPLPPLAPRVIATAPGTITPGAQRG